MKQVQGNLDFRQLKAVARQGDGNAALAFSGSAPTAGHLLNVAADGSAQDSGISVDADAAFAADSDSRLATQKATKAYVDAFMATADAYAGLWRPDQGYATGKVVSYNGGLYHCKSGYAAPTVVWTALSRAGWTAHGTGADEPAADALDGNASTKWNYSSGSLPVSFWVDLGTAQRFGRLRWLGYNSTLNFYFPTAVDIYVSDDGTNWDYLTSGAAPDWGKQAPAENIQVLPTLTKRWIKIVVTAANTAPRVCCAEFNLDNADTLTPDVDTTHWELMVEPAGATGAPADAHYLTTQAEAGLSNEANLGALADNSLVVVDVAAAVATIRAAVVADILALFSGSGDYLKSDGSKGTPSGTGDVVIGSAATADGHLAVWDGTNSKTLKDGGAVPSGSGGGTYHDITSSVTIGSQYTAAQNMTIVFYLEHSSSNYSGLWGCVKIGSVVTNVIAAQCSIATTWTGGSFPVANGQVWGFNLNGTLGPAPNTYKVFAVY